MSVFANDIYNKLIHAGVGNTAYSQLQLEDACAAMIGDKFDVEEFISNLLYSGEWHYTTQDKIRDLLSPYNGELVHSTPRTPLIALIENAQARTVNSPEKDSLSCKEPSVWLTVYKDTLGFPDDNDNLTQICVSDKWLSDYFRADGTDTEEWFAEYTADDTEDIARKAMSDGVILDCSDKHIKAALMNNEKAKASEQER